MGGNRYNSNSIIMAIYKNNPPIVTNGLALALDAVNRISYTSGSSTWRDLSSNRINTTLVGSPLFLPNEAGGSINLDGSNDRIDITSANCVLTSSRTLTAIIKSNTTTATTNYFRLVDGTINGYFRLEWNNRLIAVNDAGSNFAFQTGFSPGFPLNASYFMITLKCDENGILTIFNNSIRTNVNINTTGSIALTNIGRALGAFSPGGAISTFLFYNRALSDDEIIQNYNALKTRIG